jgi:hypothetical protein
VKIVFWAMFLAALWLTAYIWFSGPDRVNAVARKWAQEKSTEQLAMRAVLGSLFLALTCAWLIVCLVGFLWVLSV